MTVDTTFKEFVEEHGIDFSLLEVGFPETQELSRGIQQGQVQAGGRRRRARDTKSMRS